LDRALDVPKTIYDTTSKLSLSKLALRNGSASDGGCLRIAGTNAVVKNQASLSDVLLENCRASNNGGAIWTESLLTASNLNVKSSVAVGSGGGLYSGSNSLELTSVRFENNRASTGGAIKFGLFGSGSLTLANGVFTGNQAAKSAGALEVNALAVISNSAFNNNSVTASDGFGGAISVGTGNGTELNIQGGTINANTAAKGAGIAVSEGKKIVLKNMILEANDASVAGGAIFLNGFNFATSASIISSTLLNNKTPIGKGGGIAADFDAVATVTSSRLSSAGGGECSYLTTTRVNLAFTSGGGNTIKDGTCNFTAAGDVQNTP
jgi:hypothetical protein